MKAKPFIKWAGGKSQLYQLYETCIPKSLENQLQNIVNLCRWWSGTF